MAGKAKTVWPPRRSLAQQLTLIENGAADGREILRQLREDGGQLDGKVWGVTGPAGVGKSTLIAGLLEELSKRGEAVAVLSVDPSSSLSSGALLGDRIRMVKSGSEQTFIRSVATRGAVGGIAHRIPAMVELFLRVGFSSVIIESIGVGQDELEIFSCSDLTILVVAPGFGDEVQAMKGGLLEQPDIIVVNKADLKGASSLVSLLKRECRCDVVPCIAEKKEGVAALVEKIFALYARLKAEGKISERRAKQQVENTYRLLNSFVADNLRKAVLARLKSGLPVDEEAVARELATKISNALLYTLWTN